ncbi:hypothetical protein [uncultured Paraglaciecola sp.]|uniref:hypothetical protein n=1 Tax=uncultured Paraglaciecola sp. TaxID=1765024 RepID=UPI0025E8F008|nr:hypothetical protein [uncultured Paraglaciecola sp.]
MVIRILGLIVGLLFLILMPIMVYSGQQSVIEGLSSMVIGMLFIIYGVKGNKGLLKILPKNVNIKLW